MSKHTKGPLQVLITDNAEGIKDAYCVLISDNGDHIARCLALFPFDTSWDERDANAYRIELAWNSHDDLLRSLQSMLDFTVRYAEPCLSGMGERYDTLRREMLLARAAIAKATP